jgi:endo-1,4-beta-xylanase
MKTLMKLTLVWVALAVITIACNNNKPVTLKDSFKDDFYVGAAISSLRLINPDSAKTELDVVKDQFSTITNENALKWERIHPTLNVFNFDTADAYVNFGEQNKMFIIGHCMVWHAQTPDWVFQDSTGKDLTRDALLARLKNHISTIMGRYKGRIQGYDVVNEALNEDGTYRKTKWYNIIGEDYIEKAFEYAHEADSAVELYYNDYNIEQPAKREGAIKIIKSLQAKGLKISGVGIQGHYHLDTPSLKDIDESITAFGQTGVKVMFTEVDINVLPRPENLTGADVSEYFKLTKENNPYPAGLPDSVELQLANRYADFFKIFVKHKDIVDRVTFWGINDRDSWLNGWPIPGRTNYPLVFDRKNQPKKAFYSIIETAKGN